MPKRRTPDERDTPLSVVVPTVRVRVHREAAAWRHVVVLATAPLAMVVNASARELVNDHGQLLRRQHDLLLQPVGQHHAVDAEAKRDGRAHSAEYELEVVGRPLAGPRQVVQGELGGSNQHGENDRADEQALITPGREPGHSGGEQELGDGHRQLVGVLDLVRHRLKLVDVDEDEEGSDKSIAHIDEHQRLEQQRRAELPLG
eukprot:scaffold20806_cov107-Isochrysis_galbana.AAC.3